MLSSAETVTEKLLEKNNQKIAIISKGHILYIYIII